MKDGAEIKSLQSQDIPELMAQSANLLQSFQTIVNRIDSLLAGVEQGKGNIGKLLKDEELYNRLNGIADRRPDAAGRRAQRQRHDQQADLRRRPLPGAPLADQARGCDPGRPAGGQRQRRQAAQRSRALRRGQGVAGGDPRAADGSQRGQGHGRQAAEGRCAAPAARRAGGEVQRHHRQDQFRPGHAGPVGGEPASCTTR